MIKQTEYGFWILEPDSHVSQWCLEMKRLDHDQNLLPVILPYIKPGDVVVDAGAYIGDHTLAYLKAVGPEGSVWAFEPNPEAFECLTRNCLDAYVCDFALSDKEERLGMVTSDNVGASYLVPGVSFLSRTLDSFAFKQLNFFKLDVEGMEVKAIRGAKETIKRCKPVILTEINAGALARNGTSAVELINEIVWLGYKIKKVYESDRLDAEQFDLLFLPI